MVVGVSHSSPRPAVHFPCFHRLRNHGGEEPLSPFENGRRPLDPLLGQQGRQQAGVGGLGGMQVLGLRGIRKNFPKSCGLGAGESEGARGLPGIEAECASGGGRGAEGSDGAGGVPDFVVAGVDGRSQAQGDLVPGHEGGQQFRPRGLRPASAGKGSRQDRSAGMVESGAVAVVELQGMGGARVHQRRPKRLDRLQIAHPQGPAGPVIDRRQGEERLAQGRGESGGGIGKPVRKKLKGDLTDLRRQARPVEFMHEARILFRQSHEISPGETILSMMSL